MFRQNRCFALCSVTACMLVLGVLVGQAPAKDKVIELTYSDFFPAQYALGQAAEAWAREVEKRSDGRIKITMFHGGTLTTAGDCYEGVVNGASDIGQSVFAYTRGRFPLMEAVDLPGYPFNALVTTAVANDLYRKFQPKELSDTHVLYLHAHIPGVIATKDKPVRSLEDLKGLRIRCTGLSSKIATALGATPVAMPKSDQYDSLLKGVVDGTTGTPNELKGYRLAEVAKYSTVFPDVGYVSGMFVVMNKDRWNSLPPDLQKVLTDVSNEWIDYTGKAWNRIEEEGYKVGKKAGHQFIELSPAEQTRWKKAVAPLTQEYVEGMNKKGLPGKEVMEYREALIEKLGKKYPPLDLE